MKVLICCSGYSIEQVDQWDLSTHTVIAVNNAWARVKWDYFCCTSDYQNEYDKEIGFPEGLVKIDYTDPKPNENWFSQETLMQAVAKCGGWAKCGQGISLAAAYCALTYFKGLTQIGFIGADMVYNADSDKTAYYGKGIDFKKRGVSDPTKMARDERNRRGRELNTHFNRLWADLSDDEIIFYLYKRLEIFANNTYGVDVINYSSLENSMLPYEFKPYA